MRLSLFLFFLILSPGAVHAQARPTPALRAAVVKFLNAVEDNDLGRVRKYSTQKGYSFVVKALNRHREARKILDMIGTADVVRQIRWTEVTATAAKGKVKWVTVEFLCVNQKWKFDNATAQ